MRASEVARCSPARRTDRPEETAGAGPSPARWLPAILGLSVALRVAGAWYQGDTVTALPGVFDQLSYDGLARRVVGGYGFSFAEGHWPVTAPGAPTAHWSFLYTLYLAAVYAVVGIHPIVARLIQAVAVGLLQPWLAWRVGRRVFGERAGAFAALCTAGYAYFVFYAGSLMTESFYFVAILWTLDVALRLARDGAGAPVRRWVELGVAVGITVLLRQVFLVSMPALALWLWWAGGGGRGDARTVPRRQAATRAWARRLAGPLAAAAIVALLILPWTIRNYRAFGSVVLLNTNAGFAFYWGNHPIHGTHFIPLLGDGDPTYAELIPEPLRSLDEGALDRVLLERAVGLVLDDPIRFLKLSVSRIPEYVKFWPTAASGRLSNAARVASFGLLLPWMIAGVVLAFRRGGGVGDAGRAGAVLLGLWAGLYTAVHLASWTLIRYRLPVDAVLVIFAAGAIDACLRRLARTAAPMPDARAA